MAVRLQGPCIDVRGGLWESSSAPQTVAVWRSGYPTFGAWGDNQPWPQLDPTLVSQYAGARCSCWMGTVRIIRPRNVTRMIEDV
jgi:hypothetical protein